MVKQQAFTNCYQINKDAKNEDPTVLPLGLSKLLQRRKAGFGEVFLCPQKRGKQTIWTPTPCPADEARLKKKASASTQASG